MGLFTERFKPASHRVTMLQIKQEPGETLQTFQALRKDISLVQLEIGSEQHVSFVAPTQTFDLTELTKSINSHIEQTVTSQINFMTDN